ncbi:MAG: hypothetical protein HQL69_23435 [Magnetococcales bacterium]|nr:hypothetical protein [Magnetococcales bacterium]
MVSLAGKKKVYDELYVDDIIDGMNSLNTRINLVVASDVLVYIGDLLPVFNCVKKYSTQGSVFAFSTEHTDRQEFVLQNTGRYAHSKDYLLSVIEEAGFHLKYFTKTRLRKHKDKDNWIIGGIYLAVDQ